jgi:hypothetical protein
MHVIYFTQDDVRMFYDINNTNKLTERIIIFIIIGY